MNNQQYDDLAARFIELRRERDTMIEALEGLLANAPKPKHIRKDFSYILYLEAARTALKQAKG